MADSRNRLAVCIGAQLGQAVVIESSSGASGVLGVDRAAKSPPDGYTLALISSTAASIGPFAMAKMSFDPHRDLALITTVVRVPEVVVVNPALPVSTLAELVAYAKSNPARINYGSAGSGGITHLAGELLRVEAAIDIVHVPYKGAAPAINDLLGGQVQLGIFHVPVVLPHIRAGKLKALAMASLKRAASAALNSPEVTEQYANASGVPMPSSPEEFAVFLAQDQAKWGAVVEAIGFKAD